MYSVCFKKDLAKRFHHLSFHEISYEKKGINGLNDLNQLNELNDLNQIMTYVVCSLSSVLCHLLSVICLLLLR